MEEICSVGEIKATRVPQRVKPQLVSAGVGEKSPSEVRAKSLSERPVPAPNISIKAPIEVARDVPAPKAPFFGTRVLEHVPLRSLLPFVNEVMLLQFQWGFKRGKRSASEFKDYLAEHASPALRRLPEECEREKILEPKAIYGFYPCYAERDDVILLDPEKKTEIERFRFPRQSGRGRLCIADFFRAKESGELDVVGLQVVTMGPQADEIARSWFHANRYTDYLFLHGFSVEMTEAFAEYVHKQIRSDLNIIQDDARDIQELLKQGYRGSRYSFGYPACPNLEDQEKLLRLLKAERIGVSLSEEYQLIPQQSTSAIIVHHPQAKYFSV
jgi:5-methyltetrahydrofolate--homocysteine methyltransferase